MSPSMTTKLTGRMTGNVLTVMAIRPTGSPLNSSKHSAGLRISIDGAGIAAHCSLRGHRTPGPKVPIEDPAHVVLPRSSGDPRVAHDVQRPRRSAAPVHSCSITSDAARIAVRSPTPCPASIWI